MSEPGAVKQKDLFPKAGIKPADARKIRDRLLTEDDWYKEGATIWIRPSGILRLAIAEEEPKVAQRFVEMRVLRIAPNPRYVYCKIQGESKAIPCLLPMKMRANQMIGKNIRAEVIEDEKGRSYRHESLAD